MLNININLAILKHGSFFGDASVLFDVPSRYSYQISYQSSFVTKKVKPIYLCFIEKDHVLKIVNKYPSFGIFLRHRALRRLSYWEHVETGEVHIIQEEQKQERLAYAAEAETFNENQEEREFHRK